ncbi:Serine/threonine protein kinase [Modicisalibacter ilicicola DSM 19980]|uniref:Serine/threonine protein kinase n=1 Tax=Modicisalibacter ilicicola DSM 19980 TaxID=1121942 RepID=A0A1M5BV95_9GAMM|nr:bifunctional protein-serine/threonine kinase/phosphatase [Halomonas ilicicola]SHF46484.1 Serine/threonine protein kinase [Halomonas ilicicola DSM 19980]
MAKQALSLSYGQAFVAPERGHHRSSMSVRLPEDDTLDTKGACALISDSTWRNAIAKQAGDLTVRGFLADYYSTPVHWDIKTSAMRVLLALNSWSHSQSSHVAEGSYVSSLSALVLRGREGHLFHMGDTLVFRLRGAEFEQLTRDHVTDLGGYRYPSRALGLDGNLDIDYLRMPIKQGDLFLFTTQAVRGTLMPSDYMQLIRVDVSDLDAACERLAEAAQVRAAERGYGADQFCFQLVRIDRLAEETPGLPERACENLPIPPELEVGDRLDGLEVEAVLSRTAQTRVFRVRDVRSGREMVLKSPSPELSNRNAYLEHFLLQRWVVERIHSPFVVKAVQRTRPSRYLYYLMAYVPGETLTDWARRHPGASLGQRLDIARQLAKGVQAMHRREVLHQQIHPGNILIDARGQVVMADFSACHRRDGDGHRSARELARQVGLNEHSAPEYALDTDVGRRSDQYALASTLYWLLTGDLPYAIEPRQLRTHTDLERMVYRSARIANPEVSPTLDDALRRALDPQRALRFRRLSEFVCFLGGQRKMAAESSTPSRVLREPVNLWQGIAGILLLLLLLSWLWK